MCGQCSTDELRAFRVTIGRLAEPLGTTLGRRGLPEQGLALLRAGPTVINRYGLRLLASICIRQQSSAQVRKASSNRCASNADALSADYRGRRPGELRYGSERQPHANVTLAAFWYSHSFVLTLA